jgi:very-short-patch-repair endonuclease
MPGSFRTKVKYLREKMTTPEEVLWQHLRNRKFHGLKFRRQHPIRIGYVVDFYCEKLKLAIEIDGEIHENAENKDYDEHRSRILNEMGIKVLRFRNNSVLKNLDKVLTTISEA